jgi:hypothetical protein
VADDDASHMAAEVYIFFIHGLLKMGLFLEKVIESKFILANKIMGRNHFSPPQKLQIPKIQ